jgi:hypothetical protein
VKTRRSEIGGIPGLRIETWGTLDLWFIEHVKNWATWPQLSLIEAPIRVDAERYLRRVQSISTLSVGFLQHSPWGI